MPTETREMKRQRAEEERRRRKCAEQAQRLWRKMERWVFVDSFHNVSKLAGFLFILFFLLVC